jgi:hypothetical protein
LLGAYGESSIVHTPAVPRIPTTEIVLSKNVRKVTVDWDISPSTVYWIGVLVDNYIPLVPGLTGNIILEGYNFDLLDGVLLSSNNSTIYQSVTSIKILGTQNTTISGQLLEFSVINKNILTFYVPALYPAFRSPNALVVFVPFNKAGFATTIDTYESF